MSEHWPSAAVQFVLSRAAPYAGAVPFPTTWLPSSATFHSAAVIDLIRGWRPQVVIFDNAGRTAQLRAAHRSGARVIYISARGRQRSRAFRWRWMRLLDEHWIAYPELIAGKLRWLERLKLALLGRPVVRYLDVIYSHSAPERQALAVVAGAPERGAITRWSYRAVVPDIPARGGPWSNFALPRHSLAARGVVTMFAGPRTGAQVRPMQACAPRRRTCACSAWCRSPIYRLHPRCPARRHERRFDADAVDRLRRRVRGGAHRRRSGRAHPTLRRSGRCGRESHSMPRASPRTPCDFGTMTRRVQRLKARAGALGLADGIEVAVNALRSISRSEITRAKKLQVPNALLLGYDLDQPSFRHRMRSLVGPLERAGWQVRLERPPSGRYGLRTWERRRLLAGRTSPCSIRSS